MVSVPYMVRLRSHWCVVSPSVGQVRAEIEYSWLGSFRWRGSVPMWSVPMWLKGLTLEGEIVRNTSVSLSPRNERIEHYIRIKTHKLISLSPRNERIEHYIRIKTHKLISLRFWVGSGVNALCGWAQVRRTAVQKMAENVIYLFSFLFNNKKVIQ